MAAIDLASSPAGPLRDAAYRVRRAPVAVDEAIDLAKRYGSEASSRFVAGILGAVLADQAAGGTT